MKNLITFGLLLAVLTAPDILAQSRPALRKPVPTRVAGFADAACAALTGGLRVCKCRASEDRDARFLLQKGAHTLGEWEANITIYSETKSFEAMEIDLEGDGTKELIVAEYLFQSNGMGINSYQISILPSSYREKFSAPLSFHTQDYGAYGSFVPNAPHKETLILATNWEDHLVPGKKEQYAMYLTGRWFRYRQGKLHPAVEKPILARRLFNSFAELRDKTMTDHFHPYSWLRHPKTEKFPVDPAAPRIVVAEQDGVIEKVVRLEKKTGPDQEYVSVQHQIIVRLASGQRQTLQLPTDLGNDPEPPGPDLLAVAQIGFLPARFMVPYGVSLLAIEDNLEGKKVRLTTYHRAAHLTDNPPELMLWLVK